MNHVEVAQCHNHVYSPDVLPLARFDEDGPDQILKQSHPVRLFKTMNILYTTCYLDVSGVTKINYDILSRISSEAEIHICTTSCDDSISDKWDDSFKNAFREPFKLWRIAPRDRYKALLHYLQYHLIDIIYVTHSLWLYEHAARLKQDLPQVKIVDSLHVLEPYCFRGGYPDISANRFVHPYIDASILISRNLEDYLLENYQVDRRKLHVIHNGIDGTLFRSASENQDTSRVRLLPDVSGEMIGFIGRFTDQKRPLLFVDIANDLVERKPELKFYMVGSGQLFDKVSRRIKSHGLDDRIFLLPAQSDIAELLHATDVLLLPSSYEGAPLTILEALAVGVPVVASDVGAVREYVGSRCRLVTLGRANLQERQPYVSAVEQSLAEGKSSGELAVRHEISAVALSYRNLFFEILG